MVCSRSLAHWASDTARMKNLKEKMNSAEALRTAFDKA